MLILFSATRTGKTRLYVAEYKCYVAEHIMYLVLSATKSIDLSQKVQTANINYL